MPWCGRCDRYLSPPTVRADGTCPTCGGPVDPLEAAGAKVTTDVAPPAGDEQEELPPVPLHLKILGVAAAVYLGWRFIEGVIWVIHRIA